VEYILITAAKNEEKYIGNTLWSVSIQTRPPKKWIIVSDGSTDQTNDIVSEYSKKHPFIQLIKRQADSGRNFGSQVAAINFGYSLIKDLKLDLIGNLDADVSFGPDYFETVMNNFSSNPRLGLSGGWIQEEKNGVFQDRPFNSMKSVPHAVQLFRRECFEKIEGYHPMPYGGSDTLAEIMVRMNGWEVKPMRELKVAHLKPTNSAEGLIRAAWRQGQMDRSMGTHPVFEIARIARRIPERPFGIYALTRFCSFVSAILLGKKPSVTEQLLRFLRKEQVLALFPFRR